MKLFSGKRRGFSKSASEIQAFVGAAWRCLISDDSAALPGPSKCCTSLALHATNRWACAAAAGEVCSSSEGQAPLAGLRARRVLERSRIASDSLLRAAFLSRVGRWPLRPVLKHGPRSLTCVRVVGCPKPKGAVKANLGMTFRAIPALRFDRVSFGAARAYTLGPERW